VDDQKGTACFVRKLEEKSGRNGTAWRGKHRPDSTKTPGPHDSTAVGRLAAAHKAITDLH